MTNAWGDGYNADIPYTSNVYRDLAPGYLACTCLLAGVRPPRINRPFRYCELGFGQGLGLNVLAATHPHGRFTGIDFNPLHVAGARRLAGEAGLGNVEFREESFQELAARATSDAAPFDDDPFDFVVLHGVYSWVSAENRRAIVDFLARAVKPGGLVYVTYNSLTGWAPLLPLQRLILQHANAHPDQSTRRIDAALAFLNRLKDGGAAYFGVNAAAGHYLTALAGQDRRYLSHEYLNTHWEALDYGRVAADFARAKLGFVGSGNIPHNQDELCLSPAMREIIAGISDPVLAESIRDAALSQLFRRDIFMRGVERMSLRETVDELRRWRFTLQIPREEARLALPVPVGEAGTDPAVGNPMLDALAGGTPSLAEMEALPTLAGQPFTALSRFLALLVSANHAHPANGQADAARTGTDGLNRAIGRRIGMGEDLSFLAAPVTGNGILADPLERFVLAGLLAGRPAEPAPLAAFAADCLMAAGNTVFAEDGSPIATADGIRARLTAILDATLGPKLPLWRRLGVV